MKQLALLLITAFFGVAYLSSCNDTTYAQELKQEQTLIKDYIKRNQIRVINYLPADNAWGVNDYYLSPSGLYFHLHRAGVGEEGDTLELSNRVTPRYKQFFLTENSDTINNWSTVDNPYPPSFVYGNANQSSQAFQEAVSYMKKNDAVAIIIVHSKINTQEFWKPATPSAYYLKMKFQK